MTKIFPATTKSLKEIKVFIENNLISWDAPETVFQDIILACDEAVTNIIEHGYGNLKQNKVKQDFEMQIEKKKKKIYITLVDEGKAFNMKKVPKPDLQKNLKGQRIGGFGIFLMNHLMDKVEHKIRNGKNITILCKKIKN